MVRAVDSGVWRRVKGGALRGRGGSHVNTGHAPSAQEASSLPAEAKANGANMGADPGPDSGKRPPDSINPPWRTRMTRAARQDAAALMDSTLVNQASRTFPRPDCPQSCLSGRGLAATLSVHRLSSPKTLLSTNSLLSSSSGIRPVAEDVSLVPGGDATFHPVVFRVRLENCTSQAPLFDPDPPRTRVIHSFCFRM